MNKTKTSFTKFKNKLVLYLLQYTRNIKNEITFKNFLDFVLMTYYGCSICYTYYNWFKKLLHNYTQHDIHGLK